MKLAILICVFGISCASVVPAAGQEIYKPTRADLEFQLFGYVGHLIVTFEDVTQEVPPGHIDKILGVIKDLKHFDVDGIALLEMKWNHYRTAITLLKELTAHDNELQHSIIDEVLEHKQALMKKLMDVLDQLIQGAKNSSFPPLSLLAQLADIAKDCYNLKMDITHLINERTAKIGGRFANLIKNILRDIRGKEDPEADQINYAPTKDDLKIEFYLMVNQLVDSYIDPSKTVSPGFIYKILTILEELKMHDIDGIALLESKTYHLSHVITLLRRLSVHQAQPRHNVLEILELKKKIRHQLEDVLDQILEKGKQSSFPPLSLLSELAMIIKDAYMIQYDITDLIEERAALIGGRVGQMMLNMMRSIFTGNKENEPSLNNNFLSRAVDEEVQNKIEKFEDLSQQIMDHVLNFKVVSPALLRDTVSCAKELVGHGVDWDKLFQDKIEPLDDFMKGRVRVIINVMHKILAKGSE